MHGLRIRFEGRGPDEVAARPPVLVLKVSLTIMMLEAAWGLTQGFILQKVLGHHALAVLDNEVVWPIRVCWHPHQAQG